MERKKVLVLGGSGLVGGSAVKRLSPSCDVVATHFPDSREGFVSLDYTDGEATRRLFDEVKPELVIDGVNLAGGVDFCEEDRLKAKVYHFDAVVQLAELCAEGGATFVFFSTDYVFDGTAGPYGEEDEPNPLNTYGLLKLMAEEQIGRILGSHLIVRTTNVYGYDPESKTANYIQRLYGELAAGKRSRAAVDQYGNPTLASNLVEAALDLVDQGVTGLFNIVGRDRANRLEWARAAAEVFGFDPNLIEPMETDNLAQKAPRPLDSGLRIDKVLKYLRVPILGMREGLSSFLAAID